MRRGAAVAILVGAVFLLSGCQYLLGLSGAMPPPGAVGGSFDPGAFGSFDPGALEPTDPAFPGSFDPGDSFDPDESLPPPLATFPKGAATISIAGTSTRLDTMTEPGAIYPDVGAEASWTDTKGTYFQFYSDPEGASNSDGYVQLDQIKDGRHLATADPTACVVKITQADVKGLSGVATCKGLRWVDTMAGFNGISPGGTPVGAPFDATIPFAATP